METNLYNEKYSQILTTEYDGLIHYLANNISDSYKYLNIDREDLVQEGYLGMIHAVNNYKVNETANFKTYLTYYLKGYMKNYVRSLNNNGERALTYSLSTDEPLYDKLTVLDMIGINHYYKDNSLERDFVYFKHSLKFRSSLIFELFCNGFTYKEISVLLNVNEKQVDNVIYNTRKKAKLYFDY